VRPVTAQDRLTSREAADRLTSREAADTIGVTVQTVLGHAQAGWLPGMLEAGIWRFEPADVHAFADERQRWVSWARAAELVGYGESVIRTAVHQGRIEQRRSTAPCHHSTVHP